MGFRFQKRITLFPGLRINLSKSGASTSIGPRGADVNIGPKGAYVNTGIPGTGVSYRKKIGGVMHSRSDGDGSAAHQDNTSPTRGRGGFGHWFATALFMAGAVALATVRYGHTLQHYFHHDTAQQSVAALATAPAMHHHRRAAPARTVHKTAAQSIVNAAAPASGVRYVHRNNSSLHQLPNYSSPLLKKEPKGASVTLLSVSGDWVEIQDGAIKGWMRASVLGEQPPSAAKKRRRAQSD